jgi:uncharacterized protein
MAEPRFPLEGAQEKPLVFRDEVSVGVEALGGEPLLAVSPLALEGEITFADGEYFLDAVLSYSGSVECSRCLEPVTFRQEGPIHLRLHPRPAPRAKAEPVAGNTRRGGKIAEEPEDRELEAAELDVFFYDEPVLPFAEIAREQAIISLPMKPLCREDCLGLCPQCGKDLNAGDCACDKKRGDPRLEILKNLR